MLLKIIEIIFNDTTAIILQGENLLRKFMEVGDSSVENLHTCVAKFMKLRASGINATPLRDSIIDLWLKLRAIN